MPSYLPYSSLLSRHKSTPGLDCLRRDSREGELRLLVPGVVVFFCCLALEAGYAGSARSSSSAIPSGLEGVELGAWRGNVAVDIKRSAK